MSPNKCFSNSTILLPIYAIMVPCSSSWVPLSGEHDPAQEDPVPCWVSRCFCHKQLYLWRILWVRMHHKYRREGSLTDQLPCKKWHSFSNTWSPMFMCEVIFGLTIVEEWIKDGRVATKCDPHILTPPSNVKTLFLQGYKIRELQEGRWSTEDPISASHHLAWLCHQSLPPFLTLIPEVFPPGTL